MGEDAKVYEDRTKFSSRERHVISLRDGTVLGAHWTYKNSGQSKGISGTVDGTVVGKNFPSIRIWQPSGYAKEWWAMSRGGTSDHIGMLYSKYPVHLFRAAFEFWRSFAAYAEDEDFQKHEDRAKQGEEREAMRNLVGDFNEAANA